MRNEAGELAAAGLSLRFDPARGDLQVEQLERIDRALEAMEDPSFGTCALCGGEIELARLRLAPESRVCGGCAGESAPVAHLRPRET